jgi:hypothetical protein
MQQIRQEQTRTNPELKWVEDALWKSEGKLRIIFDRASDGPNNILLIKKTNLSYMPPPRQPNIRLPKYPNNLLRCATLLTHGDLPFPDPILCRKTNLKYGINFRGSGHSLFPGGMFAALCKANLGRLTTRQVGGRQRVKKEIEGES